MIVNIFKKKKITVDCFTYHTAVKELFPIKEIKYFYPEWFKKLKETYTEKSEGENSIEFERSTMKMCEGFRNHYSHGFIIPLWSDLIIDVKKDQGYNFLFSSQKDILGHIEHHNHNEYGNMFNKFIHGKIITPWMIKEKSGVKFMWTEPRWNTVKYWDKLNVVPGTVIYNTQHIAHINMFVSNKTQKINLNAGQPLVHLVPLTEYDVEIKTHLLEKKEYEKMQDLDNYASKFVGKYKYKEKVIT